MSSKKDFLKNRTAQKFISDAVSTMADQKPQTNKKVNFQIRFNDKLKYDKLKAYAQERGMSMNAVIMNSLVEQGIL